MDYLLEIADGYCPTCAKRDHVYQRVRRRPL
jgi:hypothetical protein